MQKKTFALLLILIILGGCSAFKALEFKNKYGPSRDNVNRVVAAHNDCLNS